MTVNWFDPYVLALACVIGAVVRARYFSEQGNLSRETVQDCFIAFILGLAWGSPFAFNVPTLGQLEWPPVQFPLMMPLAVRAALLSLGTALFIGGIKKALLKFPSAFETLTGSKLPATKNGGSNAPSTPPPAPKP